MATLGEISNACEAVFGRFQAQTNSISGVYKMEIDNNPYFKKAQELTDKFVKKRADDPYYGCQNGTRWSRQRRQSSSHFLCRLRL